MKEKFVFIFLRKIDSTFFIFKTISILSIPSKIVSLDRKSFNIDINRPFMTISKRKTVEHIYYLDYDTAEQILNSNVQAQLMSPEKLDFEIHNHIMKDLSETDDKFDTTALITKILLICLGFFGGCVACYLYLQSVYIMISIS